MLAQCNEVDKNPLTGNGGGKYLYLKLDPISDTISDVPLLLKSLPLAACGYVEFFVMEYSHLILLNNYKGLIWKS